MTIKFDIETIVHKSFILFGVQFGKWKVKFSIDSSATSLYQYTDPCDLLQYIKRK